PPTIRAARITTRSNHYAGGRGREPTSGRSASPFLDSIAPKRYGERDGSSDSVRPRRVRAAGAGGRWGDHRGNALANGCPRRGGPVPVPSRAGGAGLPDAPRA